MPGRERQDRASYRAKRLYSRVVFNAAQGAYEEGFTFGHSLSLYYTVFSAPVETGNSVFGGLLLRGDQKPESAYPPSTMAVCDRDIAKILVFKSLDLNPKPLESRVV